MLTPIHLGLIPQYAIEYSDEKQARAAVKCISRILPK
jgi:hypothetical protein